jgi:GAF domain-containing protein
MTAFDQLLHILSWMLATSFLIAGIYSSARNWQLKQTYILSIYMFILGASSFIVGLLLLTDLSADFISMYFYLDLLRHYQLSGFLLLSVFYLRPFLAEDDLIHKSGLFRSQLVINRLFWVIISLLILFPLIIRITDLLNISSYFLSAENKPGNYEPYFSVCIVFSLLYQFICFIKSSYQRIVKRKARYFIAGSVAAIILLFISIIVGINPLLIILGNLALGLSGFLGGINAHNKKLSYRNNHLFLELYAAVTIIAVPILVGFYAFSASSVLSTSSPTVPPGIIGQSILPENYQKLIGVFALMVTILPILLAAVLFALLRPVRTIFQAANEIASGNYSYRIKLVAGTGFKFLGEAINIIFDKVNELNTIHLNETTQNLDQLERYKTKIETLALITKLASANREVQYFLNESTITISKQLGFYHVAIYLTDETGEYVLLQATNSEEGRQLLARGYKLSVGQQGVIGFVSSTGRTRVVQNAESDSIFSPSSDLPRTQSEIAIPLKISEKMLGVLDIQSTQIAAFLVEDQEFLNIIADQIALTIEAAQGLNQSRVALRELNLLYSNETAHVWKTRLQQHSFAYRFNRLSVEPLEKDGYKEHSSITQSGYQLEVPVSLRGQTLGSLVLRREEDQPVWSEEDFRLAVDAVGQILPALENARLMDDIKQRVHLESLLGKISGLVQSSTSLESVMRTTVEEISQVLGANRVRFRLADQALDSQEKTDSLFRDTVKNEIEINRTKMNNFPDFGEDKRSDDE